MQTLQFAWLKQVQVVPVRSSDWWMIQVDAQNGNIIAKNNLTVFEGAHTEASTEIPVMQESIAGKALAGVSTKIESSRD